MRRILMVMVLAACNSSHDATPDAMGDAMPDVGNSHLGWSDDVRLTNDPGASELTFNFARSIAVNDRTVHAVWFDTSVHYKRSTDGGATWEAEHVLATGMNPTIAVSGDTVYTAWYEVHTDGGYYIATARSLDAGATWQTPVTVSTTKQSSMPSIAADGDAVQLVWNDTASGATEVGHASSTDRGATWSVPDQLSASPYDSWVSNIAMHGSRVIDSWVDYVDGNEEEYQRISNDGGATWGARVRRTSDGADSWAPSVAMSGDTVHLFWFDRRDSAYSDLDVEAPLDQAATLVGITVEAIPARSPAVYYLDDFEPRLQRKVQAITAAGPAYVNGGGSLATLQGLLNTFQTRYSAWNQSWEIYYKRSTDGGVTFGPDTRMTTAPYLSQRPSVVAVGDRVDVVWFDARDSDGTNPTETEIYYKGSLDGGVTWSDDLRLTNAPGESTKASIAATADRVHVLWYDNRDGNEEVYYKQLAR